MKYNKILIFVLIIAALFSINAGKKKPSKMFFKDIEGYVFVPGGKVYIDNDSTGVKSFYISKYEISNKQYTDFLICLNQQRQFDKLAVAQIDSIKWRDKYLYNEPYVTYYHVHPAYANYPLVNISYEGAVLYCQWLSEKYNKEHQNSVVVVEFRLPTRAEWIRAARGGDVLGIYSWNGPYLRNSKGTIMCNFLRYGDESIHYSNETKKLEVAGKDSRAAFAGDITAPVKSYFANGYGIHNMCGNVAEMVAEKGITCGGSYAEPGFDVRVESVKKYTEPSPTIGFRPIMTFIAK